MSSDSSLRAQLMKILQQPPQSSEGAGLYDYDTQGQAAGHTKPKAQSKRSSKAPPKEVIEKQLEDYVETIVEEPPKKKAPRRKKVASGCAHCGCPGASAASGKRAAGQGVKRKESDWVKSCKDYMNKHGVSYKDAMREMSKIRKQGKM